VKETTKITINLSKELLEKTKVAADNEELTVSALIRKLLLEHIKKAVEV
jgi:predicted DNA binding CopG/RHH family protein